uniref:Ig-like domain-containing protein n=1 Tax=Astyanax mexicanus TaxID=7994 RepID=W5LM76_ASTMX
MFSSFFLGGSIKIDIVSQNGLNVIQDGENLSLNCSFSSSEESSTAWFKQTPGEKPLLIASAHHSNPIKYHNDFYKEDRLIALRAKNSFILGISSAEPSDSATYFCSVVYNTEHALADWTIVVLYTVLQPPVSDPVQLGGDTTLQCSILTDNSAGDHSVYWFRHGSGESDPGIIFTHGNRSDQCKKSSETVSPTQSCIYKLPKNNLSLSDAGTYYCAVAACGHIFFGNGTKLDFGATIISMVLVLILCKFHNSQHEGRLFYIILLIKCIESFFFIANHFKHSWSNPCPFI